MHEDPRAHQPLPATPPVLHVRQQLAQQQGWGLHIHVQDLKSEQRRGRDEICAMFILTGHLETCGQSRTQGTSHSLRTWVLTFDCVRWTGSFRRKNVRACVGFSGSCPAQIIENHQQAVVWETLPRWYPHHLSPVNIALQRGGLRKEEGGRNQDDLFLVSALREV